MKRSYSSTRRTEEVATGEKDNVRAVQSVVSPFDEPETCALISIRQLLDGVFEANRTQYGLRDAYREVAERLHAAGEGKVCACVPTLARCTRVSCLSQYFLTRLVWYCAPSQWPRRPHFQVAQKWNNLMGSLRVGSSVASVCVQARAVLLKMLPSSTGGHRLRVPTRCRRSSSLLQVRSRDGVVQGARSESKGVPAVGLSYDRQSSVQIPCLRGRKGLSCRRR